MSHLTENIYDIKDLYLIKFNDNYQDNFNQEEGYIKYFNLGLQYIVEKFAIEDNKTKKMFFEVYTECITGQDFYKRENKESFSGFPDIFESITEFPIEYLDEEEKKRGKVTTMRLFQIFQEINIKSKTLVK